MLALYELPGGYALFQVVKGGGFKLVAQHHFKDSEAAVEAAEALMKRSAASPFAGMKRSRGRGRGGGGSARGGASPPWRPPRPS